MPLGLANGGVLSPADLCSGDITVSVDGDMQWAWRNYPGQESRGMREGPGLVLKELEDIMAG